MKADTYLHSVHEGLVEGVVQVRDDWAEWVDVPGVDQLLWPTQLDWMDESPHQVARGEDPLDDDQHLRHLSSVVSPSSRILGPVDLNIPQNR